MKATKIFILALLVITIGACTGKQTENNTNQQAEIAKGITTSQFKIWGNCEMCKETIEGSLKVEGVSKSDWDVDSKIMTVNYDTCKISLDQIQKNIAAAGYDTEKYKGDDNAYHSLAECCQYERK